MDLIRSVQVCKLLAQTVAGSFTVNVPQGADGVTLFLKCANPITAPSLVLSLNHELPQSTDTILIISAAAQAGAGVKRLAAAPGCTAQANILACEPIGTKINVSYTLSGGTTDVDIVALFYRS